MCIRDSPNWETLYDQCFLIDQSVDVETAYTTITDPEKGLAYVVPADRQDCYVFSEKEDTCVTRIASYVASYLSLDDVAQWTIKRVPVNELELAQADDATFCCTLGCDARYAYYLSLSTGLRWLENDAYSESRFRAEMQEGSLVIERFLEQNAITPEADWMQLLAAEAQLSSAPTDAITILDSSYANGKLYIPAGESDEFKADTAFSYSYYIGGNSSDDLQDVTYKEENAIFSFFDTCQTTYGRNGLVWLVYKYSIDELDSLLESDSEWGNNSFLLNWHILGYDSDTVYMLFCIGMGFGNPLADQLEWDALASVQSYCDHLETGLVVLENFVEKNGLTVPEGCVDWKSWYQENMLDKAKKQIETLTTAQAGSSNKN